MVADRRHVLAGDQSHERRRRREEMHATSVVVGRIRVLELID